MFPVPVLDHVVINVRDGLDAAAALYARLGFTLTSRGHHTLGSSNHLAILGTDYLELLGVQPGNTAIHAPQIWCVRRKLLTPRWRSRARRIDELLRRAALQYVPEAGL